MTIYLVETYSDKPISNAFTDKQLAESYLEQVNHNCVFKSYIKSIELVTDAFMELTLQPHKPKHQFKDFL